MQTFIFINAATGKAIKELNAVTKSDAIKLADAYAAKEGVTVTVRMTSDIHVTAPKGVDIEF